MTSESTGASSYFQGQGSFKAQGSLRRSVGSGVYHTGAGSGCGYSCVKCVELVRDDDEPSFGFNIKGGIDYAVPVHIWRVEENSLADRKGLKQGQQILQANGVDFTDISHSNALKVLKGRKYLKLFINMNGPSSSVNGTKPSSMLESSGVLNSSGSSSTTGYFRTSSNPPLPNTSSMEAYTWINRHGHEVPPPTASQHTSNKRIINIEINPGQNLGLMIRGGYEYGLGIYVTGVDHGSVAQRAGLQRGDELLDVNNYNFTSITHDKAVQILKSCRKMTIVANYIGKIPADNQTSSGVGSSVPLNLLSSDAGNAELIANTELIDLNPKMSSALVTTSMSDQCHSILMDSTNTASNDFFDDDLLAEEEKLNDHNLVLDYGTNSDSSSRLMHQDLEKSTSIMAMIEEKSRTVLNKSEHSRFTFYRLEYQQGFLPIQSFVRILLELLNTVEKYTLLTEVREIIRPCDLIQFDELIYNKQITMGQKCGGKIGIPLRGSAEPIPMQDSVLPVYHGNDGMLVDMNQEPMLMPLVPVSGPGGSNGMQGRRMSPNTAVVPFNSNYGQQQQQLEHETTFTTNHQQENNRQLLITHGDTQNVVAKLQQQKVNQQTFVGGPLHQNTTPNNSCVRYKVRVHKTKPILGIAIEGGVNTPHRLPRIIDVNTEGSAFGSQLKAGQVLLAVDGKKLDGLTHEDVARMILDCYVDMSRAQIEFVVVEAKSSFVQGQQQALASLPPPPSTGG